MPKDLKVSYLLDFYGNVLTDKQRDAMEQYYNDDLSLGEIAQNLGITRQGVRDSIKRGEGIIVDLEYKVGFAKRYRAAKEAYGELARLAREVRFANSTGYSFNDGVDRAAGEMLRVLDELKNGEEEM